MSYFGTKDWFFEAGRGNIPGITVVKKFGRNDSVSTTLVPVTASGFYRTPTAVTSLEVLSNNVQDGVGGTGLREIVIEGIGAGWTAVSQTVTMDGTTPVALGTDLFRVYRIYGTSSGSYADQSTSSQAGTITVRAAGGGVTWATLDTVGGLGIGQSQIGVYTVETGKTAYVLPVTVSVDSNKVASVYFFSRDNADDISSAYSGIMRLKAQYDGVSGVSNLADRAPLGPFVGPCDIGYMAIVSSTTASVSVDFEIYLQDT